MANTQECLVPTPPRDRKELPPRTGRGFVSKDNNTAYTYAFYDDCWDNNGPYGEFRLFSIRDHISFHSVESIQELYNVLGNVIDEVKDYSEEIEARNAKLQEQAGEGDSKGA